MKGTKAIEILLTGVMAVLVAVALPVLSRTVYAADVSNNIERLVPAESMEVELGGGEAPAWVESQPFILGTDAGYIERLLPAESQISEPAMGGGETTWMEYKPFKFGHDAGHIERLLPAESAE